MTKLPRAWRLPSRRPARATKLDDATAYIVTALLEHHVVREAIDAADKQDTKAGRTLSIEKVATLIELGICNKAVCRDLASRPPAEQTTWLADHVRKAVAGTAEQRAAVKATLDDAQFSATVAAFVRDEEKLRRDRERTAKRRAAPLTSSVVVPSIGAQT